MLRFAIEWLEDRRLFAGGLTAPASSFPLATIPSQFASFTACQLPNGNTFLSYINGNAVNYTITDPAGNTVFPVTAIPGATANQFARMASVLDSNNNIAEIFPTQGSLGTANFNLIRFNSAGTIINSPIQICSSGASGNPPAIAAGSDAKIGYLVPQVFQTSSTIVLGGIYDSSDSAVLPATQISSPTPVGDTEFLTNLNLASYPANGQYIGLWNNEDVNSSNVVINRSVVDCPFGASGAGANVTIATAENDSSAANIFRTSAFFPSSSLPTGVIITGQNFGPAPNFTPNGGFFNFYGLNGSTGAVASGPTTINTTTGDSQFAILGLQSIQGFPVLLFKTATGNPNAFAAYTLDPTNPATILASNSSVASATFTGDPVFTSGNVISANSTFSPVVQTVITGQAVAFTPPVTNPSSNLVVSVSDGVNEKNGIHFTLSATGQGNTVSTVTVRTVDGSAKQGQNFTGLSGTYKLGPGFTADVLIGVLDVPRFDAGFSLQIISATNATIENANGTATIAGSGLPPTNITITGGLAGSISDSHGTVFIYKLKGPGKAVISRDANGRVSTVLTGTTDATQLTTSIPSTPKIAFRSAAAAATTTSDFLMTSLTAKSPIGSIIAPGVGLLGNLTLKGISKLTLGNVHDNNKINLGAVKNAIVKFGAVADTNLTAVGAIQTLSVASWTGGSIAATSIGALADTGDFDADVNVTSAAKITIAGALGGTSTSDIRTLRAKQSFGDITAGSIAHAHIFTGVKASLSTLPTARSAFIAPKNSIHSVTIKGASPSFTDAIIAAPIIGTIKILGLQSTNATNFGVAAERITSYMRDTVSTKNIFSKQKIDTADQYSATTL